MNLIQSIKFNQKALASLERVQVFKYRNSKNQEFWLPLRQLTQEAQFTNWKRKHRAI